MQKLALGTVQFGLDYGINNRRGKIPEKEVFSILDHAYENNIQVLDAASVYGDSEKVIGNYLESTRHNFQVVSKCVYSPEVTIARQFYNSLSNLKSERIYGYQIHHFEEYKNHPEIWDEVLVLKEKNLVEKIGFSLYYPKELELLLHSNVEFDIVQFPLNIFDQRFIPYLSGLRDKNIEIHTRSIFLQGLVFKTPEALPIQFNQIKPAIKKINDLSNDINVSIGSLCLCFGLLLDTIDKVIIGIDSIGNLKNNIDSLSEKSKVASVMHEFDSLKTENEQIIIPSNWNH